MKYQNRLFAALFLLLLSLPMMAQETAKFPFVMPWDDASHTVIDVGALNPVPAGINGFITAKDGHFYDERGNRVRFLGVNIAADAAFPTKDDAEKVAARLHKYGINIVRLHHMDASWSKPNLFDPAFKDTQHYNKEALDRLDYFIFQLKRHGIYSNINLHVSRTYTAEDGFPDTGKLDYGSKIVDFFEPKMITLQKQFASDILTHLNPYTNTRYVDERAIAVVEINNENTLLGEAWSSKLDNLPPFYKSELGKQWNVWLKKKYSNQDGLRRAWTAADKPFGPNRLLNSDFSQGAEHWNLELNTAPASAKMELPDEAKLPTSAKGKPVRINVETVGGQNWHIQFHQTGIDLTEGEPYTVSFWAKADRARPMPFYASIDRADWHQIGLSQSVSLTKDWKRNSFAFTASRSEKSHNRLTFVLGDAPGAVDLLDISLQPGVETQLPPDARIELGDIPFAHPVSNPSGQDWIAFLIETERNYMNGMRDYVKKTLKVHANVTGSQASYGGLGGELRESASDFVDMHAYWQHPEFPRKQWDPIDWQIPNTSMVSSVGGGTLPGLARYRMAGKPFTVSEYSHPAPNDYQAECVPMLVAFAAVQDWDGFYLFDYGNDRGENKLAGYFDVGSNPAKMAFLPAAALLFHRNDMGLATEELRLKIFADSVAQLMSKNGQDISAEWESAGIRSMDSITHRLSVSFLTGKQPERPARTDEHGVTDFTSPPKSKGPIEWHPEADKSLFLADSPYSKIMVGFMGGQNVSIGGWSAHLEESARNFAALTLTSLDGKAIERSTSMLLTAVGSVENTGMKWNATRTSIGDKWGTDPTMAEGVSGQISISTLASAALVHALDGTGKRSGKVDSKLENGVLTFSIGPAYKTLWYEIETGAKLAK